MRTAGILLEYLFIKNRETLIVLWVVHSCHCTDSEKFQAFRKVHKQTYVEEIFFKKVFIILNLTFQHSLKSIVHKKLYHVILFSSIYIMKL